MAAVTGTQLLAALDGAADEVRQAMAVLHAAGLDPTTMTVGAGDRALLGLTGEIVGGSIEITATCRRCHTANSIVLDAGALAYEPRTRWFGPGAGVREPTYADLDDLPDGEREAEAALARRCSIGYVSLEDAIAALDDVDASLAGPIELCCADCGAPMSVEADIEQIVLARLRALADDVDREVHLLASRYTWDLATIEALPDRRRRRLARLAGTS